MLTSLDKLRQDLYGKGFDTSSFVVSNMIGTSLKWARIKIPAVKDIIRKYRSDETLNLDEIPLDESVELTIVFFAISLLRIKTFDEQMKFLQKKIRYANSWMITDVIQQFLKKGTAEQFMPFYLTFQRSKYEYEKRFAYIYAMKYRRENIDEFVNHIIFDDAYYVYMAQAWMLATYAIAHFDLIYSFLKRSDIPLTLKRKTISKMVDSYRISDAQKEAVKKLRN